MVRAVVRVDVRGRKGCWRLGRYMVVLDAGSEGVGERGVLCEEDEHWWTRVGDVGELVGGGGSEVCEILEGLERVYHDLYPIYGLAGGWECIQEAWGSVCEKLTI